MIKMIIEINIGMLHMQELQLQVTSSSWIAEPNSKHLLYWKVEHVRQKLSEIQYLASGGISTINPNLFTSGIRAYLKKCFASNTIRS